MTHVLALLIGWMALVLVGAIGWMVYGLGLFLMDLFNMHPRWLILFVIMSIVAYILGYTLLEG